MNSAKPSEPLSQDAPSYILSTPKQALSTIGSSVSGGTVVHPLRPRKAPRVKRYFILWGSHPEYCDGVEIKLAGAGSVRGLRSEQRDRIKGGFSTVIREVIA